MARVGFLRVIVIVIDNGDNDADEFNLFVRGTIVLVSRTRLGPHSSCRFLEDRLQSGPEVVESFEGRRN